MYDKKNFSSVDDPVKPLEEKSPTFPFGKGMSKSRYIDYCQCPKMLWLNTYNPEVGTVSSMLDARFEAGKDVGDLTKGLFGPYEDVTILMPDGYPDTAAMITRTYELMSANTPIICEAAFNYHGCYCAVDILRNTGNGSYEIYEVKSASSSRENPDEFYKKHAATYAIDIAYQKWVLMNLGYNITGEYLVCLNSDYVRNGDLNIQQLFNIILMDSFVDAAFTDVEKNVDAAKMTLAISTEPKVDLGMQCKKPYDCIFINYCLKQRKLQWPSVFNLYRAQWKKKLEYLNENLTTFADVREKVKSATQKLQIECTLNNQDKIDSVGIRQFLNGLRYPLYYLDFETMQLAVPEYDGTKPYTQVPFQYSLHIQTEPCGRLLHKEFLGESGTDFRRSLAERICADIPTDVCVIAYNKSFECTRLKELAALYPDLSSHLLAIEENIVDLLIPFQNGYYYTPAMKDSFSIKSVLPALYPDSEELNYNNLDGVHNGMDAMTIFPKIKDMSPEEREKARENLLKYCGLDTLAMVRVMEKLYTVV